MVCKNCGNFVADGHSFCSNCGAKIQIAPASGSNRKKSGSAAVWIIVAAAAAGLVAGRFIWKTTPSESPSQTAAPRPHHSASSILTTQKTIWPPEITTAR